MSKIAKFYDAIEEGRFRCKICNYIGKRGQQGDLDLKKHFRDRLSVNL